MTAPRIDFGRLTAEETQAVAREALSELSDSDMIEVIVELISGDAAMIDELTTALGE